MYAARKADHNSLLTEGENSEASEYREAPAQATATSEVL